MEDFAGFLMETGWLDTSEADLTSMNSDKQGRPFEFTDKAIQWTNRIRIVFKVGYRLTRGILNHSLKRLGHSGISLTQFYDRCRILVSGSCNVDVSEKPISAVVDSTGLSLNKYGGWRCCRRDLKSVSGWIKLHAAADPDTNRIPACAVTDEKCEDVNILGSLIEDVVSAGHRVGKILADAAYDKKDYRNMHTAKGVDVVINIKSPQLNKKNMPDRPSRIVSHGSVARGKEMRRILEIGREEWKKEKGYGRR